MSKIIDRLTKFDVGASASLGLASLPALAQGGTTERRTACMTDALTLCSSAIPDEGRIEACLRRRSARVSEACQMILSRSGPVERIAGGSVRRGAGQ